MKYLRVMSILILMVLILVSCKGNAPISYWHEYEGVLGTPIFVSSNKDAFIYSSHQTNQKIPFICRVDSNGKIKEHRIEYPNMSTIVDAIEMGNEYVCIFWDESNLTYTYLSLLSDEGIENNKMRLEGTYSRLLNLDDSQFIAIYQDETSRTYFTFISYPDLEIKYTLTADTSYFDNLLGSNEVNEEDKTVVDFIDIKAHKLNDEILFLIPISSEGNTFAIWNVSKDPNGVDIQIHQGFLAASAINDDKLHILVAGNQQNALYEYENGVFNKISDELNVFDARILCVQNEYTLIGCYNTDGMTIHILDGQYKIVDQITIKEDDISSSVFSGNKNLIRYVRTYAERDDNRIVLSRYIYSP